MRLPLQSKSKAQRRQLLRQLIWSLCLVAPGSLSFADDNAEKKNETKSTPALSLPTFPTSLPSPPTTPSPTNTTNTTSKPQSKDASAPPALLPPLPPSVTVKPTLTTTPTLAAVPTPTATQNESAKNTVSNSAQPTAAPAAARKDGVIISMPNTAAAATTSNLGAKQLPAAPTAATGGASVALAPSPTSNAKSPDQVSIKFGDSSESGKDRSSTVTGQRPLTTATPVTDLPATFRLSDKTAANSAQPVLSHPTPPQNPKLLVPPPTPLPALTAPETPKPLKAEAVTTLTTKSNPAPVENKAVEAKPELGTTTTQSPALGALTISKQGIAPSTPEKNEGRREAVLIRPKAIVLGQEPTSIAAKATAEQATPAPAPVKPTPAPVAKPSTVPQALASNSGAANASPMKKADSKVSPLPPSQLPAAEKIAIQAVVPPELEAESKTQAVATTTVAKPIAENPVLPSLSTAIPPSVVVATPSPTLKLAQDLEPSVVSDADIAVEARLASPKKYSKPADRTIQVGTIALTTMRVGDKDVVKCEVDDTSVCRAIVTADGEVALLPGKVGVTRATLWVKEPNGQSKVETADIQVGEVLPVANPESVEVGKLNDSLQRLYPNTNLRVIASDRCLEICGEADSEEQAREVLQIVRKLCLVPVKDKVTVR